MDIWAETAGRFSFGIGVSFNSTMTFLSDYEWPMLVANQWNSIDVPVVEFVKAGLNDANNLQTIRFSGTGTYYIDNIYAWGEKEEYVEGVDIPVAPVPTHNAAEVVSAFSDSYTRATKADPLAVTYAGNTVAKLKPYASNMEDSVIVLENLSTSGINISIWNISACNNIHMDVYWTGESGTGEFEFGLNSADWSGKDFKYMSDQKFFDGQTVFAFGLLQSAKVFAQTKLSYQILPLPKLDENMEGYRTSPQDSYNLVSVMSNCKGNDLALATATLECLSEQSYRLVRPEYYDIAFKIRYASEEDTAALFDMIIDNIRYEFAFVNSALIGDVLHLVRDNFIGSPNPETSLGKIWAEHGSSVSTAFEELIENYGSYNSSDRKE